MSKSHKYDWPLGLSTMTWWDKLKISKFLFTEPQWTMGSWVKKYEDVWRKYTCCPYVVATSSGSTANHLIALRRKWELEKAGQWTNKNNKVLHPVVNWISSVSPFVHCGFKPVFADVSDNLCSSIEQITDKLDEDSAITTVFYTTLLGYSCDLQRLREECEKREVKLLLDNCESSFSKIHIDAGLNQFNIDINNFLTSSTSCYISHFTSGSNELGLIFCQDEEEYWWYIMMRNHGMTRGVPERYRNLDVDPLFDFALMGTNFRSSNLLCYLALLDFERSKDFSLECRRGISEEFYHYLDGDKFEKPHIYGINSVPLAIPVIVKQSCKDKDLFGKVKGYLYSIGVQYRPIVGGNLLRQTAFEGYGDPKDFPRAEHIHEKGLYLGLNSKITKEMVKELAQELSKL